MRKKKKFKKQKRRPVRPIETEKSKQARQLRIDEYLSEKTKERSVFLNEKANELNRNIPKSEFWFNRIYEQYRHHLDKSNEPFAGKIPDIINHMFKYIIEIDGSIHQTASQKQKDLDKDFIYKMAGYKCFRVIAYNVNQANEIIKQIRELRKKNNSSCAIR